MNPSSLKGDIYITTTVKILMTPQGWDTEIPSDVFCFTLYWSLTFHTPLILSCGLYVFLNVIAFPAERPQSRLSRPIARRRKRGVIAGLLGLLVFTALCVAGVVLASAVATYILVGLFRAGKYNMST